MRRIGMLALALCLGSAPVAWAAPAHGDGALGSLAFDVYCADCHGADADGRGPRAAALADRPADLRTLAGRYGAPLPRGHLARHVDASPDAFEARVHNACNRRLRRAFDRERFAWRFRRATLFEVFSFLDAMQVATPTSVAREE